jgi:integrase/recombinase XerD
MTDLSGHVGDYLRLRRALGFKLKFDGDVLPQFVAYLEAAGASRVTADLAVAWAALPQGVLPISLAHRLGAVRGFARYLATIDPATEVPPNRVWSTRTPRRIPYLYSEADVCRLLEAARALKPPLRAASYEALFGLLAASGMRVGEALGLARGDVDLAQGVVTIREAKFNRSRLVPLHPSTCAALASYAAVRDALCPTPKAGTFLVSSVGTALLHGCLRKTFIDLTTTIGLRTAAVQPRIHDLRHSFAVRTLVEWQRSGLDIEAQMAVLSDYLGHVCPESTYWYLWAAPELMELAAQRLDGAFGGGL